MKKRIDVIAGEESYTNLATFTDIEDMNITVRAYRDTISTSIKRADVQTRLIALLELLKRHSCKYVGLSMMCKNTIADKLEVSYKTVQRLIKKLEELGMIRQVEMKRSKDMLQTANAIQIIPTQNDVSDKVHTKESKKCPTIKTITVSLKQKIKRLNKRNNSVSFSSANFIAHWVPERFSWLTTCFYQDAKTVEEFWKVVRQNNRVINHETDKRAFTVEQELNIAIRAFTEFVMKIKNGTRMNNMFGYFDGIVNNLMDKLYWDNDFMDL